MSPGAVLRVTVAVLLRPSLWPVALRQVLRLAEPGWWRRFPPLPVPPPSYLRFRLVTAYGGDGSCPSGELARDVVAYLRWCRQARSPRPLRPEHARDPGFRERF